EEAAARAHPLLDVLGGARRHGGIPQGHLRPRRPARTGARRGAAGMAGSERGAGGGAGGEVAADPTFLDPRDVIPAAGPLTTPNPSSPTARPTAGRGGAFKTNQNSLPPLPGRVGVRWERRAGEVRGQERGIGPDDRKTLGVTSSTAR